MSKVTDEQLEEFEMMFGDDLPGYVHEPIKFMYYWNMYLQVKNNGEFIKNT